MSVSIHKVEGGLYGVCRDGQDIGIIYKHSNKRWAVSLESGQGMDGYTLGECEAWVRRNVVKADENMADSGCAVASNNPDDYTLGKKIFSPQAKTSDSIDVIVMCVFGIACAVLASTAGIF